MATDLVALFMQIDAMSIEAAQRRWDELLASAGHTGDGYYGLAPWQADEFQLLSQRLGRRITWKHIDLNDKKGTMRDGRAPD